MIKAFLSDFYILKQYFRHFLTAVDQYSLHSPFVFQFYTDVVKDRRQFYAFQEIEAIRKKAMSDTRLIEVKDLGTGARKNTDRKNKISQIAKNSLSKATFSQFLFRMILMYKPRNILELGTSLGINTLYLAKASSEIPVTTLEGCPNITGLAKTNFELLNAGNIRLINANIDDRLPQLVDEMPYLDFVYFDANHSKEATLRYFRYCLKKASETSIFIFDDIHLSPEMYNAWLAITHTPTVSISIDLFDAGIIFFKPGLKKEHYILEHS